MHNNGGLYVCDFISVEIILPDELLSVFNSDNIQFQSMFLYQLAFEEFLIQQPYEVFTLGNNCAYIDNSLEEGVVLTSCNSGCLFRCGAQPKPGCNTHHYRKAHAKDYCKIIEKCSCGFSCPFCKLPWHIDSLRDLGTHIRYHHPEKGYLDFLQ